MSSDISRRRFLVMLGVGTSGIWLAETGIVALSPGFARQLVGGMCVSCKRAPGDTVALVGFVARGVWICDDCIQICHEIIYSELRDTDVHENPDLTAPESHVVTIVKNLVEADQSNQNIPDMWWSFTQRGSEPFSASTKFECSGCGAKRSEVFKLIPFAASGALLCDRCISGARATLARIGPTLSGRSDPP